MEELEQHDVEQRVQELGDMPIEVHRALVCGLIGHSRIKLPLPGRLVCARCEFESASSPGDVIVGDYSVENMQRAEALTWQDTMLTPNPLPAL